MSLVHDAIVDVLQDLDVSREDVERALDLTYGPKPRTAGSLTSTDHHTSITTETGKQGILQSVHHISSRQGPNHDIVIIDFEDEDAVQRQMYLSPADVITITPRMRVVENDEVINDER